MHLGLADLRESVLTMTILRALVRRLFRDVSARSRVSGFSLEIQVCLVMLWFQCLTFGLDAWCLGRGPSVHTCFRGHQGCNASA